MTDSTVDKAALAAKGLRVRELLLDVENAINEPPRRWDIEPADVRDYRHDLYRIWSPLRDIILAALSAHEAKEADNG